MISIRQIGPSFVGISTFAKRPYVADWSALEADVAILERLLMRALSGAQARALGHGLCAKPQRFLVLAMLVPMTTKMMRSTCQAQCAWWTWETPILCTRIRLKSHSNIETGVRAALAAGALPVVIGGDHSVNIPCINAFDDQGPFHILQIDAHLDFVDERHGVRYGHGNPMRRASEKDYVTGLTQVGIRNVSSTAKEGYEDARARGSDILLRQARALGPVTLSERIPEKSRLYVTIDIDAFCPSIAPGTGTPSHGGFLYYDVLEMLQEVSKHHEIGIDLVEVAPDYDPTGSTAILAAQVLLNVLGFIFHQRA